MNITHRQAKEAEERVTGQRFCSQCSKYQPVEGGKMHLTGKVNRWKCQKCSNRTRAITDLRSVT